MAKALSRMNPKLVFRDKDDSFEARRSKRGKVKETEELELDWIRVDKSHAFKTVFLGDSNVGKTCLARMFVDREVLEKSSNTIGFDHHVREVAVEEGIRVKLQIWDTAGMEQFRNALVTRYYRNTDGIILVYDITRKQTFLNVELWLSEVRTYVGLDKVRLTLIGNKLDQSGEREVSPEEGQALADRHGMMFYEFSAKDPKQLSKLEEIFAILAHDMFQGREKTEMTQSQSGIIRLGQTTEPDDWILVSAPDGPIPRSTYAAQEMKARLQSFLPRRMKSSGHSRRPQRNNNHSTCSCS